MKKIQDSISTMVNGIIHNDTYIFDMTETNLYGQKVMIAETVEGKLGYVMNPEDYINTKFMLLDDVPEATDERETFINLHYLDSLKNNGER